MVGLWAYASSKYRSRSLIAEEHTMTKNMAIRLFAIAVCLLGMTACGGGAGGATTSSTTPSVSTPTSAVATTTATAVMLSN